MPPSPGDKVGTHRSAQAERGEVSRRHRERHCFSTVLCWLLVCLRTLACRAFSALQRFATGSSTSSCQGDTRVKRQQGLGDIHRVRRTSPG